MWALTHSATGLQFAYPLVLIPMIVGLIRGHASLFQYIQALWWALKITVMWVIILFLVSQFLHDMHVKEGVLQFLVGVNVFAWWGYWHGRGMADGPPPVGGHLRGAVVSVIRPRAKLWWSRRARVADHAAPITLAGIPVAAADETKHFKFIGTTGTGKSTAIREMLSAALARGDRAVIADPDGGYLSHFYNPDRGDVILNPFDPDSVKWNLLGEITNDYDVDQLARSLIPDSGGSDRIWSAYARTFFTAVVQQIVAGRITDDGEIYRLVTKGSLKELKLLLADTVAGPFLEEANDKMFGSVRSVTSSAIGALKYTVRQRATPFSVRGWVRQGAAVKNGGRGGVLFLPYKAGEIAALRSSISAWMRLAIFEAMNRDEGDQRLWFVVDELDALGEIDGLKDALARLRKFGGRCVLGLQSISQVSSTYGHGVANTIVENCGSSLLLRCSASEQGGTSQFASRLIGQREFVHLSQSSTWQPEEGRVSRTVNEQRSIEPAVMASEIEQLPDLQGFLKFASIPDWLQVSLTYVEYPTIDRPKRAVTDKGARKLRARGAQSKDAPPEGAEVRGDPAENEHTDTALRVIAEERYDDADLRR
jgi:type IV secretory pathway TraG/TraD family ATPase VirD4